MNFANVTKTTRKLRMNTELCTLQWTNVWATCFIPIKTNIFFKFLRHCSPFYPIFVFFFFFFICVKACASMCFLPIHTNSLGPDIRSDIPIFFKWWKLILKILLFGENASKIGVCRNEECEEYWGSCRPSA